MLSMASHLHRFLNVRRLSRGLAMLDNNKLILSLYLSAPNVAIALALRWSITGIFILFFYSFYLNANLPCKMQASGFDCFNMGEI